MSLEKELSILAKEIRIFSQVCKDDLNSKESKEYVEERIKEKIIDFATQQTESLKKEINKLKEEVRLLKEK